MTVHRFTQHPDIARDIACEVDVLAMRAKEGRIAGLYVATVLADGTCETVFIAEERYTLFGVAYSGLATRASKEGK